MQQQHEELFANVLDGYDCVIFNSSKARLGYSGTATFSKSSSPLMQREINHRIGDQEGRFIMLEYPGVYVVNVYTMNAGTGLKRLETRMSWDSAFRKVIRNLREQGKPVVVVGDLNVAREAADVYDENEVKGQPGFTDLERQSFEDTLETCGLVDAYRMLYPEENERYTYWDYRTRARDRNHGLRIDYALVSEDMAKAVKDVQIFDNIYGSDHCPVAVDLHHGMI